MKYIVIFVIAVAIGTDHLGILIGVCDSQMSHVDEFQSLNSDNNSNNLTNDSIDTLNEIISEFGDFPQLVENSDTDKVQSEHRDHNHKNGEDSEKKRSSSKKIKNQYEDQYDKLTLEGQQQTVSADDMFRLIANLSQTSTDNLVEKPLMTQQISGERKNENKCKSKKKSVRHLDETSDYWQLELDDLAHYLMFWTYDYRENYIAIELQLCLDHFQYGYDLFALGLSHNEQSLDADWCILWFDKASSLHLQPAHTSTSGALYLDSASGSSKQDQRCKKLASSRSHDKLTILYQRPLDSCKNSGYQIDNGTSHVVWFKLRGPIRSINGLNVDFSRKSSSATISRFHTTIDNIDHAYEDEYSMEHDFRRVQLLPPISTSLTNMNRMASERENSMKENNLISKYLDITNDKLRVPSAETTYWCRMYKLPDMIRHKKHHITRYEAIIQEGHEHLVHHMELFHCENNEEEIGQLYFNWSGHCSGPGRPRQTNSCKRVLLAWAMGAKPLIYPSEVGQPVGGPGFNAYLMLEVHYNNVGRRKDFVDSSGLRFYYTHHLRDFDAGVMEVGLEYTDKNSIPPNVVAPLIGYCVSECTRAAIVDNEGINIFAAQLHTHLTGISSWTEIVREGKLIGEINRDNHYSPHFQEIRLLSEPVQLLPGDALVHYCLYDTRNRVNMTLGGYAITDEMCVTYMHYYPKISLEVCKSSIETEALMNYFQEMAQQEEQKTDWMNKSVAQNYHSIEWNPLRAAKLLALYQESPLSIQCNQSNGDRFPGKWNGIWPTRIINKESHYRYSHQEHQALEPSINQARGRPRHPNCVGGKD